MKKIFFLVVLMILSFISAVSFSSCSKVSTSVVSTDTLYWNTDTCISVPFVPDFDSVQVKLYSVPDDDQEMVFLDTIKYMEVVTEYSDTDIDSCYFRMTYVLPDAPETYYAFEGIVTSNFVGDDGWLAKCDGIGSVTTFINGKPVTVEENVWIKFNDFFKREGSFDVNGYHFPSEFYLIFPNDTKLIFRMVEDYVRN